MMGGCDSPGVLLQPTLRQGGGGQLQQKKRCSDHSLATSFSIPWQVRGLGLT